MGALFIILILCMLFGDNRGYRAPYYGRSYHHHHMHHCHHGHYGGHHCSHHHGHHC